MADNKIQILGVPFDQKSSFMAGTAEGPTAIRRALLDGSSSLLTESGISLQLNHNVIDLGDVMVDSFESIEEALTLPKRPTLFLGGDHSITYPLVQWTSQWSEDFDILHFDAHTDLYDIYEGDRYSHACPFARIMESGLVRRLVQVGIRTVSQHQQAQIDRFGVEVIRMSELEKIRDLVFERPLYVSLDLDVFDPAFAPGVSHYEPGGMSPRRCLDFLQMISVPIISADIVELNPRRDLHGMTAHLAAKLLKEMLGKMLES